MSTKIAAIQALYSNHSRFLPPGELLALVYAAK